MAGKLDLGKVRGTTIYPGTKITGVDANGKTFPKSGITKAYEEDMYVNTDVNSESQGNVYICLSGGDADTAVWAYNGNLRGPQCEVINNLESSRTDAALTAYQGRILKDMMYDSGLITKEVEIDYSGNVQGIKVTTENRATTITVQTASGNITQEKAAGAETTTVSAVPAKQILKVSSSDAYIKKIELYDASNTLVYTDNISSWKAIEDIRQQLEESGSVLDNGTTLPTGILTKIAGGMKKVLYPISHAKAIWYDKKNNKTVYDAISSLTENTEKTDAALAIAGKPDEYSTSKTYAVGDKCIYENALYKCTTAISVAEAWTAGHWTKTSLCAEDAANKAAIKELTEKREWTKVSFVGAVNVAASVPSDKCARVPSTAEEICVEITVKRNASTSIKFSQYIKTYGSYLGGYYNSDKYYASYQLGYNNNIIYISKSWLKVVDNGIEYNNADTVKVDVYYR